MGVLAVVLAAAGPLAADEYVWKDGKWVPTVKPAAGTPAGELAAIRALVERGQRKKALAAVEHFCLTYPDNPSCEEAMLLAGQAELDAGRYYQAYEQFEKQLTAYPNGLFLERALIREMEVAEAFLAGKKRIVMKVLRLPARDEGLTIMRGIADHAPASEIAERALLRIAEYHYGRSEYAEAADDYDHYLAMFPKSARAPQAMLQAAQATYASFRGVAYDETPLIEAEQRFRTIIEQYPVLARKANLSRTVQRIVATRAERVHQTARFYDRTGRKTAARFYYRQVMEEYPDSAWAGSARRALGGAAGAPRPKPAPATTKPAAKPKPAPATTKPVAKPKPAPKPVVKPKPIVKPKPAPKPKPKPATRPAKTIDLEKLAEPSSKGPSK